jgi:glycosyltransferase involved in cell wall biosynthesis
MAGTEKAFMDYARVLRDGGAEVLCIVSTKGELSEKLRQNNLKAEYLTSNAWWNIRAYRKLRQYVDAFRPDVILLHDRQGIRWLKGLRNRIPMVGIAHSFKGLKVFQDLHQVIGVSRSIVDQLVFCGISRDQAHCIPNMWYGDEGKTRKSFQAHPGCDQGSDSEKSPLAPLQKQNQGVKVIGAMGRLRRIKGFDIWIQALKILKDEGYVFHGILAGSGPLEEALYKQIVQSRLADHVQLVGWMDQQDFFGKIDIFCIPSRQEPFGLVFLEAWQEEKPVISTMTGGLEDLGVHGHNALMVPEEDPWAMADALKNLLDNPEVSLRMGRKGRQDLENLYHHRIIGEKIQKVLAKALDIFSILH